MFDRSIDQLAVTIHCLYILFQDASKNIQTHDDYIDDKDGSRDRRKVENEEKDEVLDRTERSARWNSKRRSTRRRSTPRVSS